MTTAPRRGAAGFLIIEAAMILMMIMVITLSVTPAVTQALDDARLLRAKHDLQTIGVSVSRLVNQVWPQRAHARGLYGYRLLVGPGLTPESGSTAADGWERAVGTEGVGLLNDQLMANEPDYATQNKPSAFGWRGPYVAEAVAPDPWGRRYAVNIAALHEQGKDLLALCAGPDGVVDAAFASDGGLPGGDDLVVVVVPTGRDEQR